MNMRLLFILALFIISQGHAAAYTTRTHEEIAWKGYESFKQTAPAWLLDSVREDEIFPNPAR